MNQSTQQAATPSSDASTSGTGISVVNVPSLEERSNAAFDGLTPSEPAAETATGTPPAPPGTPGADSPAGSGGVTDQAAARAERRAKLEQLAAEERARVDAQSRHRESESLRKRLEEAERRAEAAKDHVDPNGIDEERFFELATRLKIPPQRLGEWLRERMTNPELAAAQAAAKAVDPKVSALEKKLADQQRVIDEFLSQQAAQQQAAEERHYTEQFHAFTRENAATSPYAARFLEVHGPEEYAKLAVGAASVVPRGAGAQAILDEVEERLAQLASIYAPNAGAPQQRAAQIPPNHAAAKAPTTVSNTLAQTRASVVNEDEQWASLPFEERSARLFR